MLRVQYNMRMHGHVCGGGDVWRIQISSSTITKYAEKLVILQIEDSFEDHFI